MSEATQQRFRDLVNSIDAIAWEADAQTCELLFISQRAERVLGYPLERWLREPTFWRDHLHADGRDRAVALRTTATAATRSYDVEYRMVSADGRIVWLRDIVTVVREGSRPARLRGVMVDITGQKLAMERLHSQQELLALAQKAAGAMAFDWHFDRPINSWSVEQEALYGLAPGSFDGRYASWKALVQPDDWPFVVEAMTRARRSASDRCSPVARRRGADRADRRGRVSHRHDGSVHSDTMRRRQRSRIESAILRASFSARSAARS